MLCYVGGHGDSWVLLWVCCISLGVGGCVLFVFLVDVSVVCRCFLLCGVGGGGLVWNFCLLFGCYVASLYRSS